MWDCELYYAVIVIKLIASSPGSRHWSFKYIEIQKKLSGL